MPLAAASLAVRLGSPQRVSTVLSMDVWSSGVNPVGTRKTGRER